jgi:hypothetical protein
MKRYAKEGKLKAIGPKSIEKRKNISEKTKKRIKENGHPRGMLGKHHTKEAKKAMGEAGKRGWTDKNNYINTKEYRQLISDRASKLQQYGNLRNRYSRGRQGTYNINGKKMFFRSLWEVNYALYLDFLINQKQIKKWRYEVDTFWFEKIKRGVRSYKPDFKVFNNDGSLEYHEIKGWMDNKSKTKLKRMAKYYPSIKVVLIEKDLYKELKNKIGRLAGFYK